jgi:hypothetical protein
VHRPCLESRYPDCNIRDCWENEDVPFVSLHSIIGAENRQHFTLTNSMPSKSAILKLFVALMAISPSLAMPMVERDNDKSCVLFAVRAAFIP